MMQEGITGSERTAGAEMISSWAVAIAKEKGVAITQCVWDMGDDVSHEYAHRLDLFADTGTVRIYFRDLELSSPENDARRNRTEDKLKRAIDKLVRRTPASTYACH